jgi:Rps23 Pro-64 3,4-dihydroxylase Tpa1-like proline 4-hydroxylase
MARKPDKNKKSPKVNPDLEGFDVRIDSFGEIKSNLNIDKINEFLNKNVDDKKLRDREDLEFIQEKESKRKREEESPFDESEEEDAEDS